MNTAQMIPAALQGRLTVDVEVAGRALGLGRAAAYAAAGRGEIPTLRMGRRLLVPVPQLLELVGLTPDSTSGEVPTSPPAVIHAPAKELGAQACLSSPRPASTGA